MNIQRPADLPEIHSDSWDRLSKFLVKTGISLERPLGWGYEGLVYATAGKTAIKAYRHAELYENERNVYFRLRDCGVKSVQNFSVPTLIAWDDELLILQMSIASPPFILDFAGAYLDKKPPFSEEQLEEWEQEKKEQFEDRWPQVRSAVASFRSYGIYLNDVKPGNVTFADDDD
jgi:hypothetical protein